MSKERQILRLNLDAVERSLAGVQRDWQHIEFELSKRSIGKKDAPFNSQLKERMIVAYNHLDTLLRDGVRPFMLFLAASAILTMPFFSFDE